VCTADAAETASAFAKQAVAVKEFSEP